MKFKLLCYEEIDFIDFFFSFIAFLVLTCRKRFSSSFWSRIDPYLIISLLLLLLCKYLCFLIANDRKKIIVENSK